MLFVSFHPRAFHFIDLSMLNKGLMIKLITFQGFFFFLRQNSNLFPPAHSPPSKQAGSDLPALVTTNSLDSLSPIY